MSTKFIKNPVIKNKLDVEIKNPAGDIVEEISEQEAISQVGGLSPTLVTVSAALITVASVGIGNGIKDASSNAGNPGRYCTLSAECFAGKSCKR